MNDATSLDRMYDIVEALPAPWWPPAPGWCARILLLFVLIIWLLFALYRHWQDNSFVRESLSLLGGHQSSAAVSELLRRTALHLTSREELASLTGEQWTSWLEQQSPAGMPDSVRQELNVAIYYKPEPESASEELRTFATAWVEYHREKLISARTHKSKTEQR